MPPTLAPPLIEARRKVALHLLALAVREERAVAGYCTALVALGQQRCRQAPAGLVEGIPFCPIHAPAAREAEAEYLANVALLEEAGVVVPRRPSPRPTGRR